MKLFIPIVLGSGREGRQSEKAARYVFEQAKAYKKFETEFIDVRDYVTLPQTARSGMEVKQLPWQKIMSRADGLIIVSPEYNHGYPGELKLLLDQLYEEYNRKPVAICGASAGMMGGARMVECLRISLIELQMVPIRNAVYFSNISKLFDEKGEIKEESFSDRLKVMFDELVWYAEALKTARESQN